MGRIKFKKIKINTQDSTGSLISLTGTSEMSALLSLVSLSNKTSESGSYQISKGDSIDVIVWPPSDTKFFNCDSNYMTNKPLVQVYRSQTGIIEPLYIISFKKMNADHTENNSWNK